MHTVFITGCSGYVGALLVDHLSRRDDVDLIVGLDKEPLPKLIQENKKLHFIQKNTADDWELDVARFSPTFVIHTAWQIRELYGKKEIQNKWNINGSHQVFDFAFTNPSITKLIHFGSVASYGALSSNGDTYRIAENTPLRKTGYLYADEKKVSEEMLKNMFDTYGESVNHSPEVFVLRPVSITGPFGRSRTNFSLQGILRGTAKDTILSRTLSKLLSFMPITNKWTRKFVHEDDIVGSIEHILFNQSKQDYEVYNICPLGDVVTGLDMAKMVDKRAINIAPTLIRIVFFFTWHISRGMVPTPKGSWKTYSYPIVGDGTKLTKETGYQYAYNTKDAFIKDSGWYKGQSSI